MNNAHLFILCGEAFSGKSTLSKTIAEKYNAKIIGRDSVYFVLNESLALEETPESDDPSLWSDLWPIAIQGVKNQLLLGNSVVFDDTVLFFKQREELRLIAEQCGVKCILIFLDISSKVRKARKEENKITKQRHDVPSAWLENDTKKMERPTEEELAIRYTEKNSIEDLLAEIDLNK